MEPYWAFYKVIMITSSPLPPSSLPLIAYSKAAFDLHTWCECVCVLFANGLIPILIHNKRSCLKINGPIHVLEMETGRILCHAQHNHHGYVRHTMYDVRCNMRQSVSAHQVIMSCHARVQTPKTRDFIHIVTFHTLCLLRHNEAESTKIPTFGHFNLNRIPNCTLFLLLLTMRLHKFWLSLVVTELFSKRMTSH